MMMISFPFFSSSLQILNGIDRRRTVGMGVGRKRRVTSLFLFFFLTCSRHFGTFTAVGQCEIFAVFCSFSASPFLVGGRISPPPDWPNSFATFACRLVHFYVLWSRRGDN